MSAVRLECDVIEVKPDHGKVGGVAPEIGDHDPIDRAMRRTSPERERAHGAITSVVAPGHRFMAVPSRAAVLLTVSCYHPTRRRTMTEGPRRGGFHQEEMSSISSRYSVFNCRIALATADSYCLE